MQLSKSSADLAIRLMHKLHRYRSDQLGVAAVSGFFVQAIEEAVDEPEKERREIAALLFRIDASLLDVLSDLGQQNNILYTMASEEAQYSSVVTRFLHRLLPDIVRQIARIEAGLEVDVLSEDQHSFDSLLPPAGSVRKRREVAVARNLHELPEDLE